jgi:C-terminal binding protein
LAKEPSDQVEVFLVWHEKIDANYLNQFPELKGVVRYGVGYDSIDLDEIKRRGLIFCNTPDYGTDEVSDTTITFIMNILRGVHVYDHICRNYSQTWQENIHLNI